MEKVCGSLCCSVRLEKNASESETLSIGDLHRRFLWEGKTQLNWTHVRSERRSEPGAVLGTIQVTCDADLLICPGAVRRCHQTSQSCTQGMEMEVCSQDRKFVPELAWV